MLRDSPVLSGISGETLWCSACHEAQRVQTNPPVYLVIWHSVRAGVDRLDLIGWLDEAQREAARWNRHYHALHHDVQRWHEHLARAAAPEPEAIGELAEKRRLFQRLFDLPQEILTAPDPPRGHPRQKQTRG